MTDLEIDVPDWLPDAGFTGLGALGILWAVGPSIRAVGRNLGKWTDYHTSNLLRLSAKVERRLEQAPGDKQDGEVHPRVAKEVLDSALWIGDDLHQEYLAALVVGARSTDGEDDSAMYNVRLLHSLPSAAVRLHYAIYSNFFGKWQSAADRSKMTFLRAPFDGITLSATTASFAAACGGIGGLNKAANALYREQLVKDLGGPVAGTDEYQIVPSGIGASLFTSAFFNEGVNSDVLFLPPSSIATSSALTYSPPADVPKLEGVRVGPVRGTAPVQ